MVKLLLTTAMDLPFRAGEALRLQVNPADGVSGVVRALDARGGDVIALAPAAALGRRFEVMYRAVGT